MKYDIAGLIGTCTGTLARGFFWGAGFILAVKLIGFP